MRIRSAGVIAVVALALAAGGCGGGSDKAGNQPSKKAYTGSLTIWADDMRTAALKPLMARYSQELGITINVQAVSKDLQTNFVTASQSNKAPDIVIGAHDWIGNLVQNGAIDPVQLTDAQKAAFAPIAMKAVTFNGQVYGVPYDVENIALIRNTDLAPDAPASIEDVVSAGKALVKDKKASEIMALQVGQTGDVYHLYPLYTSGGGYLFGTTASGDYDPKDLGVGKQGSIDAMKKIAALGEKGAGALKRSITPDNAISTFTGKKTAFLVSGPWALNDIKQAGIHYDITPVPGFTGGKPAQPFVGVQAFYVASKGKNKAVAQEFVTNYLTKPEVAVALYKADPRPPALTAALDQVKATDPDVQKFFDAAKDGVIMPAIPQMAQIWDPLGKAEAAVIGGADPQSTIVAAGKTIESQINK